MSTITLVPAYNRDYKTAAELKKDWDANKDFLIHDISNQWDGKYANKPQLAGYTSVHIYFDNLSKMIIIRQGGRA